DLDAVVAEDDPAAVDALVGVADEEDVVRPLTDHGAQHAPVRGGQVLGLGDHDVPVAGAGAAAAARLPVGAVPASLLLPLAGLLPGAGHAVMFEAGRMVCDERVRRPSRRFLQVGPVGLCELPHLVPLGGADARASGAADAAVALPRAAPVRED